MTHPIFDAGLEIRQGEGARILAGRFPYNSIALVSNGGRVVRERFAPGAFAPSLDAPEQRIDMLLSHDFARPLANREAGSLVLTDTADALVFEASIPDDAPSWVVDAERAVAAGLMLGISPGFRVLPGGEAMVSDAGVQVRQINRAYLREISLVSNDAYTDSTVELRDDQHDVDLDTWRRQLCRIL